MKRDFTVFAPCDACRFPTSLRRPNRLAGPCDPKGSEQRCNEFSTFKGGSFGAAPFFMRLKAGLFEIAARAPRSNRNESLRFENGSQQCACEHGRLRRSDDVRRPRALRPRRAFRRPSWGQTGLSRADGAEARQPCCTRAGLLPRGAGSGGGLQLARQPRRSRSPISSRRSGANRLTTCVRARSPRLRARGCCSCGRTGAWSNERPWGARRRAA
jgi:hypothetical protein